MKKSQQRWLGHLFVCLFRACVTKRRPRGKPRTCWGNYISRLAWEHLGIPLVELEEGRGRGKSDSYSTLVTKPPRKRRKLTDFLFQMHVFFQTLWWTNDHLLNAKGPDGAFSCNTNFQALLCFGKYQSNVAKHIKFSAFSLENGLKRGMRQYFVQTNSTHRQPAWSWAKCIMRIISLRVFGCITREAVWHVIWVEQWVHMFFPFE